MAEEDPHQPGQASSCRCFNDPHRFLVIDREIGMDSSIADVSLLVCPDCGQLWLRYFYEIEAFPAFPASGRWYLGAITTEQAAGLIAQNAKATLEGLGWYFYGGSYFGGRSGRASGALLLNP